MRDKGVFALHSDARSILMYDYLFWQFTSFNQVDSFERYVRTPPQPERSYALPDLELVIAFGRATELYGFRTGGYAPGFLEVWWNSRIASGHIVETADGYRLTDAAIAALLDELATVAGEGGQPYSPARRRTLQGASSRAAALAMVFKLVRDDLVVRPRLAVRAVVQWG
ncbi:hypothetical protein KV557_39450 [Kitasatospora aureofaciens]|uniref:hypothetical protein n=1 Tax=Kitasatospora aureofaciens TaxID=1894 RepID=UPI001C44F1F9|nr:hypothetical protein [Kitasatospora aureofaciens]MBV6703104.1 hypothetical protein [Kitasatospora aureofaciens]